MSKFVFMMRPALLLLLALLVGVGLASIQPTDWPRYSGPGDRGNRYNPDPSTDLTPENAHHWTHACYFQHSFTDATPITSNSSTVTPTIVGDRVYWDSFSGLAGAARIPPADAVNGQPQECEVLWRVNVQDDWLQIANLTDPNAAPGVRHTPAAYVAPGGKDALFFAGPANGFTLTNLFGPSPDFNALLNTPIFAFSVDADTGALNWRIEAAPGGLADPSNLLPSTLNSPTVFDDKIALFGVSSLNNFLLPGVPIGFRGKVIAVDVTTQTIKYTIDTVPPPPPGWPADQQWYAGSGVWAGSFTRLPGAGPQGHDIVFASTGQLYNVTETATACLLTPDPVNRPANPDTLEPAVNTSLKHQYGGGLVDCLDVARQELLDHNITAPLLVDSVFAFDLETGEILWHTELNGLDSWGPGCLQLDGSVGPGPGCSSLAPGPDWDVGGSSPQLVKLGGVDKLVTHHKGGALFILDPLTGAKEWAADVCTGSGAGGIHFGLASDPERNLFLGSCSGSTDFALSGAESSLLPSRLANGDTTCAQGYFFGIDLESKDMLYQVAPGFGNINERFFNCSFDNGIARDDAAWKFGVHDWDVVYKNVVNADVKVSILPDSEYVTDKTPEIARAHGPSAVTKDVVVWPAMNGGAVFVRTEDGAVLNTVYCDQGAFYGGLSAANGAVAHTCGNLLLDPDSGGRKGWILRRQTTGFDVLFADDFEDDHVFDPDVTGSSYIWHNKAAAALFGLPKPAVRPSSDLCFGCVDGCLDTTYVANRTFTELTPLTYVNSLPAGFMPGSNHNQARVFSVEQGEKIVWEWTGSTAWSNLDNHPFGDAVSDPYDDPRVAALLIQVFEAHTGLFFGWELTNKGVWASLNQQVLPDAGRINWQASRRVADSAPGVDIRLRLTYNRVANEIEWSVNDEIVLTVVNGQLGLRPPVADWPIGTDYFGPVNATNTPLSDLSTFSLEIEYTTVANRFNKAVGGPDGDKGLYVDFPQIPGFMIADPTEFVTDFTNPAALVFQPNAQIAHTRHCDLKIYKTAALPLPLPPIK